MDKKKVAIGAGIGIAAAAAAGAVIAKKAKDKKNGCCKEECKNKKNKETKEK